MFLCSYIIAGTKPSIRGAAVEHCLVVAGVVPQVRVVQAGGGAVRPVLPGQLQLQARLHQAAAAALARGGLHADHGDRGELGVRGAHMVVTHMMAWTVHIVSTTWGSRERIPATSIYVFLPGLQEVS